MKKLTIALLVFVLTAGVMTGCRKNPDNPGTVPGTSGTNATIMPSTTSPTVKPTQPKPSTRPSTRPTEETNANNPTGSTGKENTRDRRYRPY